MKTRVKKKQFKQVEDNDLIGIKWKTGVRGLLIKAKEGIICLNNGETDIQKCFTTLTKVDYLGRASVKRDIEKVYVFDNNREMLNWFAKK